MSDVDALDGEALDTAVAETVMGWHKVNTFTNVYGVEHGDWADANGPRGPDYSFLFSRDPSFIGIMLDKALADGCHIGIRRWRADGATSVNVVRTLPDKSIGGKAVRMHEWEVFAPTIPLALCRALVKAYRGEVKPCG